MQSRRSGYTLVELVIVIVVVSILLLVGMPRFRRMLAGDELHATCRELVGLVRSVREQAMGGQQVMRLRFDFAANRVWVEGQGAETADGPQAVSEYQPGEGVRLLDLWSRRAGTVSAGEATLLFFPKGYVEQAIIHLEDEGGRRYSLELMPFLGTVELHEGYLGYER